MVAISSFNKKREKDGSRQGSDRNRLLFGRAIPEKSLLNLTFSFSLVSTKNSAKVFSIRFAISYEISSINLEHFFSQDDVKKKKI